MLAAAMEEKQEEEEEVALFLPASLPPPAPAAQTLEASLKAGGRPSRECPVCHYQLPHTYYI